MKNLFSLKMLIVQYCGISIAAKAKTVQTEEVSATGADQNVTGNTSQDREFIRFENEHYMLTSA